jgi:hypothetical protein
LDSVTFCARNELAPLVLAPSEQVDEAAALLIAEACNERGERVSVHRLLAFSATWSATSRVARRNLFVFNGCNGRRSGLQPASTAITVLAARLGVERRGIRKNFVELTATIPSATRAQR